MLQLQFEITQTIYQQIWVLCSGISLLIQTDFLINNYTFLTCFLNSWEKEGTRRIKGEEKGEREMKASSEQREMEGGTGE